MNEIAVVEYLDNDEEFEILGAGDSVACSGTVYMSVSGANMPTAALIQQLLASWARVSVVTDLVVCSQYPNVLTNPTRRALVFSLYFVAHGYSVDQATYELERLKGQVRNVMNVPRITAHVVNSVNSRHQSPSSQRDS